MSKPKLKVIILTHGGAERLLELLATSDEIEIGAVFLETRTQPTRSFREKIERSIRYDGVWATVKKFGARLIGAQTDGAAELDSIRAGQNELEQLAEKLDFRLFKVEDYHSADARELLRKTGADLGILYGTNIIKQEVFSIPRLGSINIHQGLTPFYRGGPSVFWELFNGEKENGVTVHFVAKKVDTGDVILQRTFPLEYDFEKYGLDYESFLDDYRALLSDPMAEMIVDAVKQIAGGTVQAIEQDLSLGKRYRLPIKSEKDEMVRILRARRKGSNG